MEEIQRKHKEATWGWWAVVAAVLDGLPKRRTRTRVTNRQRSTEVVTPWSHHSPSGWSA